MEDVVIAQPSNLLAQDLDEILEQTSGLWDDLRGHRVFITGGTGFFGCWLLESLLWANERRRLGVSVAILARNATALKAKAPHLAAHSAVTLYSGDIRTFEFPNGPFSYVIHAATSSASSLAQDDPLLMFDTIVTGTRRTLDFADRCGARRLLFTSSGAVYGRQPNSISHLPEEYSGGPDLMNPVSAYAEGKRAAEFLCSAYQRRGLHTTIARCFAFVGPYLPLDAHFAAGNFVGDALAGRPIRITGDGSPYRAYMYGSDLAAWLWTILLRGEPGRPYNVGSPTALSISELADVVAGSVAPPLSVLRTQAPSRTAAREQYVPSMLRAETELGLRVTVSLADAIRRTMAWHVRRHEVGLEPRP